MEFVNIKIDFFIVDINVKNNCPIRTTFYVFLTTNRKNKVFKSKRNKKYTKLESRKTKVKVPCPF